MPSVDYQVVGVRFDNADFSRKIAETTYALDRFRYNLQMQGSSQGLAQVNAEANKLTMQAPQQAVDGLGAKFTAMTGVAIAAFAGIATKAFQLGEQLVSAFSIDPVMDGFREYETNMNSIQTILANTQSKGSTLDDVNKALDELNEYSDKTIYNFAEMARNIGTFTAAGVDLDTSVSAIKGIANIAAISGSSSAQASTAMYQLSQALATGTVRLQDWRSVENAGMGGEVFKTALFETGKALGTINDIPMDTTLAEWEEKAGSFRATLTEGEWLTTEVLTTALSAFTGDLSQAQLMQIGYTKEQAVQMERLGKLGIASATEVKTITQLIGTVKEAIGTGWADSFRVVIGDFEEAKSLLTAVNTGIANGVANAANARYEVLKGWKDFGGRNAAIEGLVRLFQAVMSVVNPIKRAFRELFPAQTTESLLLLTDRFRDFATRLKIGGETAEKVHAIFSGVFSILKIGIAIIKGVAGVIGDLFSALAPAGSGAFSFAADLGTSLTNLQESLVGGGKIKAFFDDIGSAIGPAASAIQDFIGEIRGLFSEGPPGFDRLGKRLSIFETIASKVAAVFRWVTDHLGVFGDAIAAVTGFIGPKIEKLRAAVADFLGKIIGSFDSGDFSAVSDALNVGLIGGILLAVRKITSIFSGNFTFAGLGGGVFRSLEQAFQGLTGVLGAMQAQLKAQMLQKIAIAVGVLTISIVALSLIDSAALTKSLTAIAVGFGQLVTVMALLTKLDTTGIKFGAMAVGLGLLAVAILILSLAVRSMAGLGWEELARGLAGVAGGLLIMTVAMKHLGGGSKGLIKAGLAMIPLSLGLWLLSKAVKSFAEMNWDEMARGLAGVAGGLLILVVAMKNMPDTSLMSGLSIIALALGLKVLASAILDFAGIEWSELGQGLAGIAAALAVIAIAMHNMPDNMLLTAVGLALVGVALKVIASAVSDFAGIDLADLAKSIGAIALVLLVLVAAANGMNGALMGAAAMVVVAGSLMVLAQVMTVLGNLSLEQIGIALLALAGAFIVIGLAAIGATYIAPGLILLAASLLALGAAFALIGVGAILTAKAFEIFAASGGKGLRAFQTLILGFTDLLPIVAGKIALFVLNMAKTILLGIPPIVDALVIALTSILDGLTDVLPALGDFISQLIEEILNLVEEHAPRLIEVGFQIIQAILTGLSENVGELTDKAVTILIEFLAAITERMPDITNAGVELLVAFLEGIAERADDITTAAVNLLLSLVQGIADNIFLIQEAAANLLIEFMKSMASNIFQVVQAGGAILRALLLGISQEIFKVVETVTAIIIQFIFALGSNAILIIEAGATMLRKLMQGIADNIQSVVDTGKNLVIMLMAGTADAALDIAGAGLAILTKLLAGIADSIDDALDAGIAIALKILDGLVDKSIDFVNKAGNLIITFMSSMRQAIDNKGDAIRRQARLLAGAIINGITGGLAEKATEVADELLAVVGDAWDAAMGWLGAKSPSRRYMKMGGYITDGLKIGLNRGGSDVEQASKGLVSRSADGFRNALAVITESLGDITDIQPVIAPVLDLSAVENEARRISGLMATDAIVPTASFDQARHISHTSDKPTEPAQVIDTTPKELVFNQVINSPTPLTTEDIYRNTKSQIALAKEKLEIP